MKTSILILLTALTGCASVTPLYQNPLLREPATVKVTYDEFYDQTMIETKQFTLKPMEFFDREHHKIEGRIFASCPGKTDCNPHIFTLHISSTSENWMYLDFRPLVFLFNGGRIEWGEVEHRGSVMSGGSVLEQMFYTLTRKQLAELAYAPNLRGKLGITEFFVADFPRTYIRAMTEHLGIALEQSED